MLSEAHVLTEPFAISQHFTLLVLAILIVQVERPTPQLVLLVDLFVHSTSHPGLSIDQLHPCLPITDQH